MEQLLEKTEALASALVTVDANDLQALAAMHDRLKDLGQELAGQTTPAIQHLTARAAEAGRAVERIILREATDAAAELRQVDAAVRDLQAMIQGALGGDESSASVASSPTTAPPATSSLPAPAPAPAACLDENPINAEDAPLISEFIGEARSHIETAEAEILKLDDHPEDLEAINAIFRSFHTMKGVAGFLNLRQIGALAHSAESLLDLGRKGELTLSGVAIDVVLEAIDLMKLLLTDLEGAVKNGTALSRQGRLPELLQKLGDCAAGRLVAAPGADQPAAPAKPSDAAEQPAPAPAPAPAPSPAATAGNAASARDAGADATVKVATTRLDSLINMVGELVIAESMVHQDVSGMVAANQRLGRNVSHLSKITRQLQELSMSMRMVPIQGAFQKMARLVRDLGRKAGKQIEFISVGGDTELDRNVVEAISDPLVHMVRNSVDHGIEPPEQRAAAGKPAVGRVELKAWHQAGSIVIQISDDGRGLNRAKILRKATEAGLVAEGATPSDQEIFLLIFHAGLSTAEKVTDISGRGVGMDVVRQNIEALRGRIDIESTEGKGSTFTIRLPLTLAVIDGMVVKVGSQRYILPITSIEQSLQPKAQQISTVQGRGEMCMVREALIPLFRLHRLFNVTPQHENPTEALVVVVQDNGRRCGVLVDELLGQQQVVIKSLGDGIGKIQGVSGGAILGDGNVSMILDVPGLISCATGG